MEDNQLNPAYVKGLSARNRLTDARGEVWNLLDVLPMRKQVVIVRLYNELCQVQGELEKLFEDVPANSPTQSKNDKSGGRNDW